ncbi:hypothetical protein DMUE_3410 [Dictyocoela muelleri]|nr:hypothetical protein DMUE_3410 [Dictyocoela muelleri]
MHTWEENSINYFNKSILVSKLNFDGYRILGSWRRETIINTKISLREIDEGISREGVKIQQGIATDSRFDIASFEYKNEESGLKMIHKLTTLVSLEEQNILNWRTSFKELSRICNWSYSVQRDTQPNH